MGTNNVSMFDLSPQVRKIYVSDICINNNFMTTNCGDYVNIEIRGRTLQGRVIRAEGKLTRMDNIDKKLRPKLASDECELFTIITDCHGTVVFVTNNKGRFNITNFNTGILTSCEGRTMFEYIDDILKTEYPVIVISATKRCGGCLVCKMLGD